MTLTEAAKAGITRVRGRDWCSDNSYVRIILRDDGSPFNVTQLFDRAIQQEWLDPTPMLVGIERWGHVDFVEYTGLFDPADKTNPLRYDELGGNLRKNRHKSPNKRCTDNEITTLTEYHLQELLEVEYLKNAELTAQIAALQAQIHDLLREATPT